MIDIEKREKFWKLRDEILRRGVEDFQVGRIHITRGDFPPLGKATVLLYDVTPKEWAAMTAEQMELYYDEAIEAAEKMLAGLPEPTVEVAQ